MLIIRVQEKRLFGKLTLRELIHCHWNLEKWVFPKQISVDGKHTYEMTNSAENTMVRMVHTNNFCEISLQISNNSSWQKSFFLYTMLKYPKVLFGVYKMPRAMLTLLKMPTFLSVKNKFGCSCIQCHRTLADLRIRDRLSKNKMTATRLRLAVFWESRFFDRPLKWEGITGCLGVDDFGCRRLLADFWESGFFSNPLKCDFTCRFEEHFSGSRVWIFLGMIR